MDNYTIWYYQGYIVIVITLLCFVKYEWCDLLFKNNTVSSFLKHKTQTLNFGKSFTADFWFFRKTLTADASTQRSLTLEFWKLVCFKVSHLEEIQFKLFVKCHIRTFWKWKCVRIWKSVYSHCGNFRMY